MRVVKPISPALLQKGFQNAGKSFWTFSIVQLFQLETGELRVEQELWKLLGDELADDVLDQGMPKRRGEFLVYAVACPPAPVTGCRVSARVGNLERELYVAGDRYWKDGKATDAEPFDSMPLDWPHAFGGEGYAKNPRGKGYVPREHEHHFRPLPNVEEPSQLIRSLAARPEPASFRAFPIDDVERMKQLGTFDQVWKDTRFPGFPANADWGYFNVAPSEQQALTDGYFEGDEPFEFELLCPGKPKLEGRLPNVQARCFIRRTDADALEELKTRLDTVAFFPHRDMGVLIFRAATVVREDDAADLDSVMPAIERIGEVKSLEHYADVFQRRSAPGSPAWALLIESDLMPGKLPTGALGGEPPPNVRLKAARRRAEKELERVRELLARAGVDPRQAPELPLEEDPPTDPELIAEKFAILEETAREQRRQAEEKQALAQRELERIAAERGVSPDAIAETRTGGPPRVDERFSLAAIRRQVSQARAQGADISKLEAQLEDPALADRLQLAGMKLIEAYQRAAHVMPEAPLINSDEARRLGGALVAAARAGEDLTHRDFTRADIEGEDLSGLDLSGAFLEGARLSGATLDGTNLSGVVLARADLKGARLRKADLSNANLGGAILDDADLGGASLEGVELHKAKLRRAKLSQAKLPNVLFFEAEVTDVDFSEADLSATSWLKLSLQGCDFSGANLERASFVEASGEGVRFERVRGSRLTLVECNLKKSRWRGADLRRAALAKSCDLSQADFRQARAEAASFRGSILVEANFGEAHIERADLTECDARGAKIYRADLSGAVLSRCDLRNAVFASTNAREALLDHANLRGADLRGANLFRSDLSKALVDKDTLLDDALLEGARVVPRSDHE